MNKRMRPLSAGCLILILALTSCSKPKNKSDLYGTYISYYKISLWDILKEGLKEPIGIAKEKLVLNSDGTFLQEVTLKATLKVDIARGTWTYTPETGYVSFNENFMTVLNGFGELDPDYVHPKLGGVSLPASKDFSCILLGTAENVLYKKIN